MMILLFSNKKALERTILKIASPTLFILIKSFKNDYNI